MCYHTLFHFCVYWLFRLLFQNWEKNWETLGFYLFLTRLLTSEDEYKWYWHQMIYFPETINTISTTITPSPTHSLVSSWAMHINLLCACWHREAMRGSSSLASCHLLMSSLFPCLGSTDAPCSRLGDLAPPFPIWLPHSQGPRTPPYRDLEHYLPGNWILMMFPKIGCWKMGYRRVVGWHLLFLQE